MSALARLERKALEERLAAAAAAHPGERVILFVDRRERSSFSILVATFTPASPWHPLLPPAQITDLVDADR